LEKLGWQFVLYSLVSGFIIGVGVTSFLRNYLKKHISLERFAFKEFGHITLALLVAGFFYGVLNFVVGYVYGEYGPSISEEEMAVLKVYANIWILIFNSLFIIGCWIICYLVIKLLLKLNKDRIARLQMSDRANKSAFYVQ